ncbi:ras-interacting protein 1 [Xyrauchen texanus]|uniref:ras-interacting protein 1 n=1 Tax=Xyrauchen texanus TaxID=154827 RepID=UPI00224207DF|nr:ras-interacting protein 1 [Xyrauchen texanus]XP_052003571.1 ras-interacting protein 1 [Xyrauchen texanus]XP_052003572.1 ras-interacting protein 1 [Xyrauchen texanus]XP_052003573.1 ras-interacting protein 1 [Xyrauchen texanus]
MEESGSPRFRKLHFPVGLWINSPRKHFAKLGARWPSAASVKSTTSSDAASLHEAPSSIPSSSLSHSTPSLAPPSPSPTPAFLRPRPANQQSRAKRLSHLFLRGRSNSDRDRGIGEREREIWAHSAAPSSHHYLPPASSNAPGLVKIYGDALSSGANYRSLLANIHSTARQLIQQVITRYTERERENESEDTALQKYSPEDFLLCDVIGKPIQQPDGAIKWETECRRSVASWECPLQLVDMWRPKDGYERRFEIQCLEEYEREEKEKEKERERDGESYQGVRWRRSRMASGGGPEEERGHRGRNTELRRSISDMNLSLRRRQGKNATNDPRCTGNAPNNGQDRKNIVSMIATEQGEVTRSRGGGEADKRTRAVEEERDTCDLEVMSQSLILPPTDRPYFLLLQGYDQSKDFVLYIMVGHTHVFGRKPTFRECEMDRERERKGKRPLKVDTFLSAPDLLVRHLLIRRDTAVPEQPRGQALAYPFRGGPVTLNGAPLYREAALKPGDLLGLGSHFLFLYRDPRVTPAPPLALPPPWQSDMSTSYSAGSMTDRQEMLRQYLGSTESLLRFHGKHADALLQEIISKNSTPESGGGALAPAYLLSLMIDYASKHLDPALTPQLLLKAANQIKGIVWDKIKEFGDKHSTQNSAEAEVELPPPSMQKLSSDLRPLMFWMSNATELLNFFQVKVEAMEKEWEFEAPGDPVLSADMDTCSEALAQLDDVIMHTFQQCVYHLTKTLYSLLPALLDTNPFSSEEKKKAKAGAKDRADSGGEGDEEEDVSALPPTVAGLVEVYRCSLQLSREACLSPPLTSQTFGYLFFFTNTSLLNTLLERDSLFSWSRAVQIRTNLDLVLDWLQGAGLGDIASEFLKKLSVTVNFLCVPKTRLIQSSWSSLQEEHSLLSSSQLHHLLTHYKLGPARAPPSSWAPPPGTELGGDIFESFLDHPPLILPNETPRLDLSQPIPSPELQKEVTRLRTFLWGLDQDELPANQRTRL